MERQKLFDSIEERLGILAYRIAQRSRLNLLDLNIHSENFFADLLNLIFGWELKNLNAIQQNAEGIDLQDVNRKIVVQVSSTSTKAKIESSLSKDLSAQVGWHFYFISIAHDAKQLRKTSYQNPHHLVFFPSNDIFDVTEILRTIQNEGPDKLAKIDDFLKKEFPLVDPSRIDSGLTTVIKILALENWDIPAMHVPSVFRIEDKIAVNDLQNEGKTAIQEYAFHHSRVDKIYTQYDKMGANKSLSILAKLRQIYATKKSSLQADALFSAIVAEVINLIQASANYEKMAQEELELYVHILVVDAFVRCKIFENPSEVSNASAR